MPVDFYYMLLSAPCRGALLTARQLNIDLNMIVLNLMKGEQMSEAFISLNPEHTVPTIKDGNFVLWESRAISSYFVTEYCKGDWLYPEDAIERAQVDKLLMFDAATLLLRFNKYVLPVIFQGAKPDMAALKSVHEALRLLDQILLPNSEGYAASLHITVADHFLAATVETIRASGISIARYSAIKNWLEKCKSNMPGYDENIQGAEIFGTIAKARIEASK